MKSSFYLALVTLIRALNGLIVLKILATYIKPAEFGYLSQIMGVIAFVGMFAAGGISNGLTRQLAAQQNEIDQHRWLSAGLLILLWTSLLMAGLLIASSSEIALRLVNDHQYTKIFILLALSQLFIGVSALAQSVAAARSNYLFIVKIYAIGAMLGLASVVAGILLHGVLGAAMALVFNAAAPGLVALSLKGRALLLYVRTHGVKISTSDITELFKFASITLLGAASLSISQIATRNLVAETLSWDTVGLWQTVVRVSDVYMQLVSVLVMGYVLPNLSKCSTVSSMRSAFLRFYTTFIGIFLLSAIVIYLARELIIKIVFSEAYLDAVEFFLPQLIGDFFRITAIFISIAFLSRGLVGISIFYEVTQGLLTFVLTMFLIKDVGSTSSAWAYCITYFILALILLITYNLNLNERNKK